MVCFCHLLLLVFKSHLAFLYIPLFLLNVRYYMQRRMEVIEGSGWSSLPERIYRCLWQVAKSNSYPGFLSFNQRLNGDRDERSWSWALFHVRTSLLLIRLYSEEIALWRSSPQPGSLPGSASWTSPQLQVSFCYRLEFTKRSTQVLSLSVASSSHSIHSRETQLQMLVHLFDFPSFPGSWLFNSLPTHLLSDNLQKCGFYIESRFFSLFSAGKSA